MTLPQIHHAMAIQTNPLNQAHNVAAHRRKEMLDRIIQKHNWPPSHLLDLPISEIARHLSVELENASIDPKTLTDFIEQFVQDKTNV